MNKILDNLEFRLKSGSIPIDIREDEVRWLIAYARDADRYRSILGATVESQTPEMSCEDDPELGNYEPGEDELVLRSFYLYSDTDTKITRLAKQQGRTKADLVRSMPDRSLKDYIVD